MLLPQSYAERIIRPKEGEQLREAGWTAADLHVHSNCSPDVLPSPNFHPEAIYQTCLQRGMGFITITDHDNVDAYDILGWERENLVTGVEITLLDPIRVGHTIHINVYDFGPKQFDELLRIAQYDRNIETFVEYLRDQNLPYIYNHPFWFRKTERPNYRAVEDIVELFPAIEYNMKRVRKRNLMALWLAAKHGKGILASTDTHIGEMGAAYTLARGETFRDFFAEIVENRAYIVPRDMNLRSLNEEIETWVETLLDIEGREKRISPTKIEILDTLLNFLIDNTTDRFPRSYPVLRRVLRRVARSGVASGVYVGFQNLNSYRIRRMLGIPAIKRIATK